MWVAGGISALALGASSLVVWGCCEQRLDDCLSDCSASAELLHAPNTQNPAANVPEAHSLASPA